MFSDMFWALYLIDVFSDVGDALVITSVVALITLVALAIYNSECYHDRRKTMSWALWRTMPWAVLFGVVIMLTPSKQTMYMMLGVKTTENVVESPLGKKLQTIIDAEVDGYIAKLKPNKPQQ